MNFFQNNKKLLLIIAFILVVILIGAGIYYMFFKNLFAPKMTLEEEFCLSKEGKLIDGKCCFQDGSTCCELPEFYKTKKCGNLNFGFPATGTSTPFIVTEPSTEQPELLPGAQPSQIANGGLTQTTVVTDTASLNPTLRKNGNDLQYYNEADGKFYKISQNGDIIPLTDKVFYAVDNVIWSPTKEKAILEYPDGSNIIYDFNNGQQISLPKHWEDFDFSPSGENIVMKSIGLDPDNRWLAIVNDDGSNVTPIEPVGNNADIVIDSWSPNNQSIAMYTEGIDFNRQEVFFVGLNNENFKSTVIEGRNFQPKWSPEGERLLYSVYSANNDMKPNLWIVDAVGQSIGNNRKNLHVETFADKCAFADNTSIYCAIPNELPEGAGWMPEIAAGIPDKLYQIDTYTGMKKLIAIPDQNFNMKNLIISDDGKYLYFTDASTQRIHKIELK